jgi:GTP-binding protein
MVALVGRPNVGKSSLLNAVVGERIAIVHDKPGVTRDRLARPVEHRGRWFSLVDMGGIGIVDEQKLDESVELQINAALAAAAVVIFVLDVRDGVTPLDREVADIIRKCQLPYVLVANKVDSERHSYMVGELTSLGLGRPLEVSALEVLGIEDFRDAIVAALPEGSGMVAPSEEAETRIAFVGQRNAGKSTLLNALLGEERVIVSELPGTTRDSVDVQVKFGDRIFTAIDTAGMRKERKLKDSIEFYSQVRAHQSIERADVVLLLIDARMAVSQVDKKIADQILEAHKPCVLVINKWDLAEEVDTRKYLEYLSSRLPLLHYAPVVFVSAKERIRLRELVDVAFDLNDQAHTRVPTPELNRVLAKATEVRGPRVSKGKYPKVYFATQVGVNPPWVVLFVNDPMLFKSDYKRFLENRFREAFPFKEIPLRISFRERRNVRDA